MKDAALKHVLVSPYGIFEILMEVSREQQARGLELRIGATGNPWSYATLNIMAHTIDGGSRKKIRRGGELSDGEWGDRYSQPRVWIFGGESTHAREDGQRYLQWADTK